MATRDLVVQLRAKVDQFQKDLAMATRSLAGVEKQTVQLNRVFTEFRQVAIAAVGGLSIAAAAQMIKMGAAAKQTEDSFNSLAESVGENGAAIISAMRKATAETVDDSDLMQKAIKGMALGLSGADMTKMAEMARQTARVTGESVGQTFEKLADAISTNMPRALKQMGLVTKEQMQVMEKAISAGVENVSLLEIAYANFQTQQRKMGELAETEAEKIQQLNARWTDLKETIGQTMIGVLVALSDPIRHITESLKEQEDQLEENIDDLSRLAAAARGFEADAGTFGTVRMKMPPRPREPSESRFIPDPAARLVNDLKAQTAALEAKKKAEKDAEAAAKKAQAEQDRWLSDYLRDVDQRIKAEAEKSEKIGELAMLDQKWRDEAAAKDAEIESEAWKRWNDIQDEKLKKAIENDRTMIDLTLSTAEAMERNFSDLFFDAMQGNFKDLGDYATAVFNTMQRLLADYLAQEATIALFGREKKEGGRTSGLIQQGIGLLGSLFGAGGAGGFTGAEMNSMLWVHRGGVVGQDMTLPRLHGGLKPDEFPAILQAGEEVIPRDEAGRGEPAFIGPINIQAVDAVSFTELAARNPQAIVGPFLNALKQGGFVVDTLRSAVR